MDPKQIQAALEAIKNGDGEAAAKILESMIVSAAAGGAAPASEPAAEAASETADPTEPKDEMAAQLTAAREEIATLRDALKVIEDDRAEVDAAERVELVAELVKLRAETPATAWEGEPAKRQPVARLVKESIKDLRSRVAALRALAPKGKILPPSESPDLTEAELSLTAKMTPEQKTKFIALRASRRSSK